MSYKKLKDDLISDYVPLTLNEVKDKIKKNKRTSKRLRKKSCYLKMNKNYKSLDWNREFFTPEEVKFGINDPYFKSHRRLHIDKEIRPIFKGNYKANTKYAKHNIESICLLREIAANLEEKLFQNNRSKEKTTYIPFYYDSKYLGKVYIGSFSKTLHWKQQILNDFLKDKEYIFDVSNEFGRPLKDLRRFLGKNLIKSNVEKWDYYFQRFLSEKH